MADKRGRRSGSLMEHVGALDLEALRHTGEAAWTDAMHRMEAVYADLVRYEEELEAKNTALEEAQVFIAGVLASISDVLLVCDVEGRVRQVNHALERLVGRAESQLLGQPFQPLFADESRPLVDGFAAKIRESAVHDCELSLRGADGQPVPLAVNCTSHYDHEGRLVGMVLIGRPVGELRRAYEALARAHTALQQAQRQLIQSEKMASLGRLVAGVAHELNNPISFVYGNVHALQRYCRRLETYLRALHGEVGRDACERLRKELRIDRLLEDLRPLVEGTLEGAERVRDIVQELKRFSSGQRGTREAFDLCEVIRMAVQWATKGARRPMAVSLDLPERLSLLGYPGQIQQVLVNLVQNAMDATAGVASPALEMRAVDEGERVRVLLHDNGPGIPPEHLLKVFDPFFTTKPVGQGTGLGLSISYGIIKDHGGCLEAANHPQGGAVFTMTLPRQ